MEYGLEFSLFITTTKNKYLKFYFHNLFDFDTGVSSIFGYVTCPANFKLADYNFYLFIHCTSRDV